MTVWSEAALLGIYTLNSTHYGTGQTTGAVDLPIARDAATGLPVLPATGSKGVLRDYAAQPLGDLDNTTVTDLFGADISTKEKAEDRRAGRLAFKAF